jgi:hypothetical protein
MLTLIIKKYWRGKKRERVTAANKTEEGKVADAISILVHTYLYCLEMKDINNRIYYDEEELLTTFVSASAYLRSNSSISIFKFVGSKYAKNSIAERRLIKQ